ncbi:MAG: hypothetical protein O7B35_15290, partial [Deltaproteobacteria bacterium]|nr:hypothetical protein [Deltaproteobacteria bacterium]
PLCNFVATVTEEITQDDGAETTRAFIIEGQLDNGKPLPPACVPGSRFGGMTWVTEEWGLRAIVHAGQATRDYLREAIQVLSPDARSRRVFTHTGWREIDGQWVYLTTSGAVGEDVFEVDLGSELSRYRLPLKAENPIEAIRVSIKLLDIAPLEVTAPLWAGVYRAPLATFFPVDFSLWLEGLTGSLKSTIAGLLLCHFGDFDRTHLPGAWSSTTNQLERRAFLLKDTLFVVDDYAPTSLDRRELEMKAARLLRSQGNLAGRGRLRSDLTERVAFPPRGLILATGEQHPPGQSLLARTLLVEVSRKDLNMELLTEAQKNSGLLQHAMAGYIQWLSPQIPKLPELLRETFKGTRTKATVSGGHLRIPEVLAHLWLGLDCGLTYAEDIGACSQTDVSGLRERSWKALLNLAAAQAQYVEDERPSLRFLKVLSTLVTQEHVTLLPKSDPEKQTSDSADFVGWYDDEMLYLLPEAAFMAVSRFCRDAGEPFSIRLERLKRDLAEEGFSEKDQGRLTTTVRINNKTRRVLKLKIKTVESLLGEEFPEITSNHHYHHFSEGRREPL